MNLKLIPPIIILVAAILFMGWFLASGAFAPGS